MAIHQALRSTTESVEYTIHRREKTPMPSLPTVVQPCNLLVATFGAADPEPYEILCFHAHMTDASLTESDYLRFHHQQLTAALSRHFPFLPRACAKTIAAQLTRILRSANASHRCHGGALSAVHMVDVQVRPLLMLTPQVRPAAQETVHESILDNKRKSATGELFERASCVVCTEENETGMSSPSLPCSPRLSLGLPSSVA